MCDAEDKLTMHRSLYSSRSYNITVPNYWKSDSYLPKESTTISSLRCPRNAESACGEYYKRYEHDEIPVKDSTSCSDEPSEAPSDATGDSGRKSLTNSDLDKLETKVLLIQNTSLTLPTQVSNSSLDSNIKFFKTTVQQIFDNFYTTMQDFEQYKKKFQEILARNKSDSTAEMEEFIKDMIQHIMSSESVSHESRKTNETFESRDQETNMSNADTSFTERTDTTFLVSDKAIDDVHSVVEAYKNENYQTDSTIDEHIKIKRFSQKGDNMFNINLLNSAPHVQIQMNNRNLLSEYNMKEYTSPVDSKVASADNLRKMAAKRTEMENHAKKQEDSFIPDRDIPVRISSAKKDIRLDEDFICESEKSETSKSFMFKICNYFCKRFRKNALN